MQPATRTLPRGALCAAIAASVVASAVARAGEPDSETAGTLVAAGQSEAAHGRVRAAAESCRRALRLANEAGDEALARAAFACVEDAERRVAHLVVRGAPPDTMLSFYGGPPEPVVERLVLDPGTVVVTVIVPDGPREPVVLELRDGEEHVLDVASLARVPDEPPRPPSAAPPPLAWVARPRSPAGTVSVGVWTYFGLVVRPDPMAYYGSDGPVESAPTFNMPGWAASLRVAVHDDVELGATETFTTGYLPGDLLLALGVRLLPGDFELGLEVTGRIPGFYAAAGGGYVALRGSGRIDGVLRVDGSFGLGAVAARRGRFGGVGLMEPVGVAIREVLPVAPGLAVAATLSPIDTFYVGLDSGLGVQSFAVPSSVFIPLGFRLGGSIAAADATYVDLELRSALPYLIMPVRGAEPYYPQHQDRTFLSDGFWVTFGFTVHAYP
ncbi:MAG: hypothetical protein IT373_09660 [Polyangiaceae bacterium]|nr:hypothetical protein [Polyangiaceae bacterium]